MRSPAIDVIGAGLAGTEAAWQIAERGIPVRLIDMKPEKRSPAHVSDQFAELVCSNSLRSDRLSNAAGVLKAEMELLDSLIMQCARRSAVPAGGALAVDRERFSSEVTDALRSHPLVEIVTEEVQTLAPWENGRPVIVAAGPLCTDELAQSIAQTTGTEFLRFYDAVAPIVAGESVNMDRAFWGSRYGRGSDYVNCPMNREEYERFHAAIVEAPRAPVREFEESMVFEGCMPIESMALRGPDTMRFGPLKPRGLADPRTGREPFAVVQLRKEDEHGRQLNVVGFQTRLRFGAQKDILRMIPGLEHAEILRYGVMHRNTFLCGPEVLDEAFRLRAKPWIRFAGQITGVEGYIESAASGLLAGMGAAMELLEQPVPRFGPKTTLGALGQHVSNRYTQDYQPSNVNFGMLEPLTERIRNKEQRNLKIAERALDIVRDIRDSCGLPDAEEEKSWS